MLSDFFKCTGNEFRIVTNNWFFIKLRRVNKGVFLTLNLIVIPVGIYSSGSVFLKGGYANSIVSVKSSPLSSVNLLNINAKASKLVSILNRAISRMFPQKQYLMLGGFSL